MKLIKAFIKPSRIQIVVRALSDAGFESVTLSKGEGTGTFKQKDASYSLNFNFVKNPVAKLELLCQNEEMEKAIQLICGKAKTPDPRGGIVYVSEIENVYQIKTAKPIKKNY